jgi:hypothetical protein
MKLPESKADLGSGTFDSTIVILRSEEVTSQLREYVEGAPHVFTARCAVLLTETPLPRRAYSSIGR